VVDLGRVALFLAGLVALAFASRLALSSGSWRAAPTELLAFLAFSIVVVAIDFGAGAFAPSFHEASIQYTGWVGSMTYLFGAIMALAVSAKRTNRSRIILIGYLAVFAVGHAVEFWGERGRADHENPYLRVSPYRPIWTVLIPLLWMAVLLSPRVKRYCLGTNVPAGIRI